MMTQNMASVKVNTPSRHRKDQRRAAPAHVDGGEACYSEAARAAIALLVDFELALARAKLGRAAPVQRPVLELDGAVFAVDGLGETENLPGLANDVRMQAFAGIDPIPAAADHGLAIVGADGGHNLLPGGRGT